MSNFVIFWLLGMAAIGFYCGWVFHESRLYTLGWSILAVAIILWIAFNVNHKYPVVMVLILAAGLYGMHLVKTKKEKNIEKEEPAQICEKEEEETEEEENCAK